MAAISRTIDLDGIANDGLGYTVTITGPPRKRSKLNKWSRTEIPIMLQRKASMSKSAHDGATGLEIPMQTEVMVHESYHAIGEKRSHWGSLAGTSENMTFENVEFGDGEGGLEYLGDESFLKPASEAPVVAGTKDGNGADESGSDNVEALPAMPRIAAHPSKRPSRGSS
jgi:hypothetical protein